MQPLFTLKQKAFWRSVSVLAYSNHLYYSAKTYGQFAETKVNFEDLSLETSRNVKVDYWSLIIGGGLMLSILSSLILAVLKPDEVENSGASWMMRLAMFTIGFALFVTARSTTVFLHTHSGRKIGLMAFSPSKENVEAFIYDLHTTLKAYMVGKYANNDDNVTPQELQYRLDFLLHNRYISQEEYDSLKSMVTENKIVVKGFGKG